MKSGLLSQARQSDHNKGGLTIVQQESAVNEKIRTSRVLVIDDEGTKIGIMITKDALSLARDKGLDLVEVAPKADPPVARIMDYGKYIYAQQKRQRDARKKQVSQQVKEIKFRTKTEEHDLQTKLKKVKEFLENGDRVKIRIMYRGREMAHPELGHNILNKILGELESWGKPMEGSSMQGRNLITVVAPYAKGEIIKRQKQAEDAKKQEASS